MICQLYAQKKIEIKFEQFVFCKTKYRSSVSTLQMSGKKYKYYVACGY